MPNGRAQGRSLLKETIAGTAVGNLVSTSASVIQAARQDPWLRPASGADATAPVGGVNGLFAEGASFRFNLFLRILDGFGNPADSNDAVIFTFVVPASRGNVLVAADIDALPTFLLAAETGTNPADGEAWGATPEAGNVLTMEELMGTTTTRRGTRMIISPDPDGFIAKGLTLTAAGSVVVLIEHKTIRRAYTLAVT